MGYMLRHNEFQAIRPPCSTNARRTMFFERARTAVRGGAHDSSIPVEVCTVSKGMRPTDHVLWEPAVFENRSHTRVRLLSDGKVMQYDPQYMRKSGSWFRFADALHGDVYPVMRCVLLADMCSNRIL